MITCMCLQLDVKINDFNLNKANLNGPSDSPVYVKVLIYVYTDGQPRLLVIRLSASKHRLRDAA